MIADLQCVVLDCPDPMELAEFYCSLVGGVVNQQDRRWGLGDDWATLHTPVGFVLAFQRAADYQPPQWPGPSRPQQFHLDFAVSDLDRAHEQVLAQGREYWTKVLPGGAGASLPTRRGIRSAWSTTESTSSGTYRTSRRSPGRAFWVGGSGPRMARERWRMAAHGDHLQSPVAYRPSDAGKQVSGRFR